MPSQTCVVNGCKNRKGVVKHKFPKDESLFQVWVTRSCYTKLKYMSQIEVRERYVMCDEHFENNYKILGTKRLHEDSVPTLKLPAESGVDVLRDEISVVEQVTVNPNDLPSSASVYEEVDFTNRDWNLHEFYPSSSTGT